MKLNLSYVLARATIIFLLIATSLALAEETGVANPLRPPDTSSPRATLMSFQNDLNRSYAILHEAHRDNMDAPGYFFTSREIRKRESEAEALFLRGMACLDLSDTSVAYRRNKGYRRTLFLKEILDHIELPPPEEIPDAEMVQKKNIRRWEIPNTDLVIRLVEEGPREGDFLFSKRTVSELSETHQRIQNLPYADRSDVTPDFYQFYISTPGRLLPPKWFSIMPKWTHHMFFEQTVWQWLTGFILTLFMISLCGICIRTLRRMSVSGSTRHALRSLLGVAMIVTIRTWYEVLSGQIHVTGALMDSIRAFIEIPTTILWGGVMISFCLAVGERIVEVQHYKRRAPLIRAVSILAGIVLAIVLIFFKLERVGVSLAPLLTSLGVAGVAISLAARRTLENVLSSFMIFWDNPYEIDETIIMNDKVGTVESIGLRSTQIRLLTGHLTVVPNELMASSEIENLARRPHIRGHFSIRLRLDTSLADIERAVEIVKTVLSVPEGGGEDHPNWAVNQPELPPRVYFNELNPDSLSIVVYYWFHPPDYWEFLEHAEQINLAILSGFADAKLELAFPTQTLQISSESSACR
jgi:MscS family membrane protein